MKHWLVTVVGAAALLALSPVASGGSLREYQAKGAFLVNFARFIEWPEETFEGTHGELSICFGGEEWIASELDSSIRERRAANHDLRLRRPEAASRCHLLFVSAGEPPEDAFRRANDFTVMVGEQRDFLVAGGHIQLYMDGDQVRFDIASAAARSDRFAMSSRLLILARPPGRSEY